MSKTVSCRHRTPNECRQHSVAKIVQPNCKTNQLLDKLAFPVSNEGKKHNCVAWGMKNLHQPTIQIRLNQSANLVQWHLKWCHGPLHPSKQNHQSQRLAVHVQWICCGRTVTVNKGRYTFQLHCALPYFASFVWGNIWPCFSLCTRLVGHCAPFPGPQISNVNPVWGMVQDKMHVTKPIRLHTLRGKITTVIHTIPSAKCQSPVTATFLARADVCTQCYTMGNTQKHNSSHNKVSCATCQCSVHCELTLNCDITKRYHWYVNYHLNGNNFLRDHVHNTEVYMHLVTKGQVTYLFFG
jgi:hypothetical protein